MIFFLGDAYCSFVCSFIRISMCTRGREEWKPERGSRKSNIECFCRVSVDFLKRYRNYHHLFFI